ncbi:MAG: hypothetical protein JWO67_3558 [Streptosporangiaceae bacterium]|nr:hypothetical protein [Streptosporangiaceae bacterium]
MAPPHTHSGPLEPVLSSLTGVQSSEHDEILCPHCGHPTRLHPEPERTDWTACAERIWDEDHDRRDEADLCRIRYARAK